MLHNKVIELEKVFINSMYDFLPEYLTKQKSVKMNNQGFISSTPMDVKKAIEFEKLKQDNEKLKRDVGSLEQQKKTLEKIIEENPRTSRDIDFAILEKKISMMEKNQRLKALEINSGLKDLDSDYGKSVGEEITNKTLSKESEWKKEKAKLVKIIKQKNIEVSQFRTELDTLLSAMEHLKSNKKPPNSVSNNPKLSANDNNSKGGIRKNNYLS